MKLHLFIVIVLLLISGGCVAYSYDDPYNYNSDTYYYNSTPYGPYYPYGSSIILNVPVYHRDSHYHHHHHGGNR